MNQVQLYSVLSGQDRSLQAALLRISLAGMSPAYGTVVGVRNYLFDTGFRKIERLPRPTISIGNLTTGGTGKTPLVIDLARQLSEQGSPAAVLLRGYRPQKNDPNQSDESTLIRNELDSRATVEASPNRAAAAQRVLNRDPQTRVFLLDDGFQHRHIHRDLDLVLIDATCPFGFGRLLPRGLLREPYRNLHRADAVIVTHADQVDQEVLAELDDQIASLHGQPPIAHSAHRWTSVWDGSDHRPIGDLRTKKVLAVCGIGNPASFAWMVNRWTGQLLDLTIHNDHHAYSLSELEQLIHRAEQVGADALLTTGKDWIKWKPLLANRPMTLPVLHPILKIEYLDGGAALEALIRKTVRDVSTY